MGVAIRPGDVLDGAYVVERLLGQGGMGAVYVAREERLGRRVAIKVLNEGHDTNPEALARFEREARSAAALQSDHAARVYSVGHLANRTPYIVMELLEGEDLAGLIARRGMLAVHEVISMMLQVCDALSEAHALGIVHRDLKPANIFLARRPSGATTIKVLDFGISKGMSGGATVSPLTATKAVMGTPLYMSPEQVREVRNVDVRTDVWSLGGVMYELLTGRSPFHAETLPDVFQRILEVAPRRISEVRPDMPPAFEAVVMRCLEKDPSARFASARELAAALASTTSSPSGRELGPSTPPEHVGVGPDVPTAAMAMPAAAQNAGSAAATVAAQARNAYAQPIGAPPPTAPMTVPQAVPPTVDMTAAPYAGGAGPTPPVAAPPALAGTVDPLVFKTGSTTRAAADGARPSIALAVGVFFGVVAVAGLVVYLAIFRGGDGDAGRPSAANGSASASATAPAAPPLAATPSATVAASAAASATTPPPSTPTATAPVTFARPAVSVTAPAPISTMGKPPPPPSFAPLPPSQPPPIVTQQPKPPPANSGTLTVPSKRTD